MNQDIYSLVAFHEGYRSTPYKDNRGNLTVGYGFCFDRAPMTPEEAKAILQFRLDDLAKKLSRFPWFGRLSMLRQYAITDMAYNLGIDGMLGFHHMIDALENADYAAAAVEGLQSLWAKQVGQRAEDDMEMLRLDQWPQRLLKL